jgi:hypothetical protein
MSDIERAVERVYDVLPPLAATVVGDVINGATVTGRVLPQHVQQNLAAEVLDMGAEVTIGELDSHERESLTALLIGAGLHADEALDVVTTLTQRYRMIRREASDE